MGNQDTPFAMIPYWVLTNKALAPIDRVVYCVLMTFCDKNLCCFPSHEAVAERVGCSPRTVKRSLGKLREAGAVEWEQRYRDSGMKVSNLYRVRFENPIGHQRPNDRSPVTHMDRSPVTRMDRSPVTHKLYPIELYPIELDTPYMSPTEKREELEQQFQQFWDTYPRHENQRRAFTSFRNALARGTPLETILTGAQRYADDPNRAPQYTKHPATWLDNDCWTDDPLPARHQPHTGDIMAEIIDDLTRGPYNANFGNSHLLPSTPTWQWETDQPIP